MSTTIYHNHHIVPRHAGGTDDPSNLVKLSIEEHAEAHRKLYEQYGRWQDSLAYRALSGMIGNEEVILESISHKGERNPMYGKHHSPETRKKISEKQLLSQSMFPRSHTEDTKKKMSESSKKGWDGNDVRRELISNYRKGTPRPKIECPHCGKVGGEGVMKRWHFDNCKVEIENKQCPHCDRFIAVNNYPRWHGDNCKLRKN